jgi:tetratricopeptide (TPR) repeat protein
MLPWWTSANSSRLLSAKVRRVCLQSLWPLNPKGGYGGEDWEEMSGRKRATGILTINTQGLEIKLGDQLVTNRAREVKLFALLALLYTGAVASDGWLEATDIGRIDGYRTLQTDSLKSTIRRFVREMKPQLLISPPNKAMEFFKLDDKLVSEVVFDKNVDEVLSWLELSPRQEISGFSPQLALAEALYEATAFETATNLVQEILDTTPINESSFRALLLLSRIREKQGRLDEAWELLRRAEDSAVYAEGDNTTRLQLQQVRLFRLSGETNEAVRVLTLLQRKVSVREGLFWGQVETLAGLLLLDREDREPKDALPYFERAASAFTNMRWWWGVQASYANMGLSCFLQGQRKPQKREWFTKAKPYFEQAISFSKGTGFRHDSAEVFIYLAKCKRFLNDWENHTEILEEALSLAAHIPSRRSMAEVWLEQGENKWAHGDREGALQLWRTALDVAGEDEREFLLPQIIDRLEGLD